MKKITVLLADDHMLVREGINALLQAEKDIDVIGQAETGSEAVEMACRLHPDVVVMDIAMPVLNGLEATRQIREKVPAARILILSAFGNSSCIQQVLALGATGYLIKKSSIHILAQAIRHVQEGHSFFDPSISVPQSVKPEHPPQQDGRGDKRDVVLTERETEVLQLIAEGLLNKQVADRLGISAKTSEKHRYSLMEKLGIHDTAGLTRYAIASGISEQGPSAGGD